MFFLIFVQNMFAALAVVSGKFGIQHAPPILYASMRLLLGGSLFVSYYSLFKGQSFIPPKKYIIDIVILLFIQLYMVYLLEIIAAHYLEVQYLCVAYNLAPFIAAGLSYVVFNEKITKNKLLGFIIAIIGFFPIIGGELRIYSKKIFSFPALLMIFAVIGNTYGYILIKKFIQNHNETPRRYFGFMMVVSGFLLLLTSFIFDSSYNSYNGTFSYGLLSLIITVVIGNIISYSLYTYLLMRYTVTLLSFAGLLYPFFGSFFGWLFLHEKIDFSFFLSLIILAMALYIFYREELKLGYIKVD